MPEILSFNAKKKKNNSDVTQCETVKYFEFKFIDANITINQLKI